MLTSPKSVFGVIGPFRNYIIKYKVNQSIRHQEFEHILRVIKYNVRKRVSVKKIYQVSQALLLMFYS